MKKRMMAALVIGIAAALVGCGSKVTPNASTAADNGTQTAETSTEAKTESGTQKTEAAVPTEESKVDSGTSGENVTLSFSWWGGDSRHAATIAAVDAFMKENPNIQVNTEYGAWDGWIAKVATQLMSGTAPDLMQGNSNWLYQYSGDGSKFVDLNDFSDILAIQQYPEDLLKECTVAGKLQGLPIGINTKCFWWNQTTFEKAGISIPETWDELFAAGKQFKEKLGDDYYPFAMDLYERMMLMVYYLQSKYQKPWAVDNQLNYSADELKEGLEFLNKLEDSHVIPDVETVLGDGAATMDKNSNWIDGHYAGIYEWDGTVAKYIGSLGEGQNIAFGPFLKDNGQKDLAATTKITQVFSITATSKHPKEAAMLLNFITDEKTGVELMGTERGLLANEHANQILKEAGLLSGPAVDNHDAIAAAGKFSLDPNFENSALKDSTGIYCEVQENLSAGDDPAELAQYLLDESNKVYSENPIT